MLKPSKLTGFEPSTFDSGAAQFKMIASSAVLAASEFGASATLAVGSTSKKFEKAAFCPDEFTNRIAYRSRAVCPANSKESVKVNFFNPKSSFETGKLAIKVLRDENSSSERVKGVFRVSVNR